MNTITTRISENKIAAMLMAAFLLCAGARDGSHSMPGMVI